MGGKLVRKTFVWENYHRDRKLKPVLGLSGSYGASVRDVLIFGALLLDSKGVLMENADFPEGGKGRE